MTKFRGKEILDKFNINGIEHVVVCTKENNIERYEWDELTGYYNLVTEQEDEELSSYREVLEEL